MVTTLGAAFAAAAVVLVAFCASLMTTLCAEAPLALTTGSLSVSAITPAPAPPPMSAAPTSPAATPSRQRPGRCPGTSGCAGVWNTGGTAPVAYGPPVGWPCACWYPGVP